MVQFICESIVVLLKHQSVAAIQSIIDVLKEDGQVKDSPPASTYIDMSYLRAVEKERLLK